MGYEGAKRDVQRLAFVWAEAELPTLRLTFSDYVDTLAHLQAATNNRDTTTHIVHAVVDQAIKLERSGEWVNAELKFETHAEEVGDRRLLLGRAVEWQGAGDDALDLYNERPNRFK